jgi:hypothetical protein
MKIALVGSAPSSIGLGPYKDRTYAQFLGGAPEFDPRSKYIEQRWEVWGCSPGAMANVPRADRWFEVHRWEPGAPWFPPVYLQFLRDFKGPVYVGGYVPKEECPNGLVYPIKEVEAEFSSYFLSSSLSLMFAMAIMEIEGRRKMRAMIKALPEVPPAHLAALLDEKDFDDEIGIWGVDMAAREEYGAQRSGCHFFILECLRRNIAFYCPPESDLLRPKPIYGLSEWDWSYIKATQRGRELAQQHAVATAAFKESETKLLHMAGYQAGFTEFIETWLSPYGLPAGVTHRLDPNQPGLGGGVTVTPGTPVSMAAPDASRTSVDGETAPTTPAAPAAATQPAASTVTTQPPRAAKPAKHNERKRK